MSLWSDDSGFSYDLTEFCIFLPVKLRYWMKPLETLCFFLPTDEPLAVVSRPLVHIPSTLEVARFRLQSVDTQVGPSNPCMLLDCSEMWQ